MTPDGEVQEEVRKLRDEVGELKTTTRVTKHDVANLQQTVGFINTRLDKIQDQIAREVKETRDSLSGEMKGLSEKIAAETRLLSSEIAGINVKQEKGVSFFAGMSFLVITVLGALLGIAVALKSLFGGN